MSPDQTSFSLDELSQESGLDTRVIRSFIEHGLMRGPSSLGRYARYSRQHLQRLFAIKVMKEKQGLKLSEVRQQLLSMSEAEIAALAETGSMPAKPPDSALDYILTQSQQFMNNEVVPINPLANSQMYEDDEDEFDIDLYPRGGQSGGASEEEEEEAPQLGLAESIRAKLGFKVRTADSSILAKTQDSIEQSPAPFTVSEGGPGWEPELEPEDEQRITGQGLATPVDRLLVGLKQQTGDQSVRKQAKKEIWYRIQITPDIELSVRGIRDDKQLARLERVADYLREILTGGGYE